MRAWHGVHKALADPLRIQIVELLWETPRSARELADRLGMPADRLYYHLGQLERAALVEVVEYRRLSRGKVERVYAPAAVEPPGDAADPAEVAAFLGTVLEATRADVTTAFQAKQDGRRREVDLHRSTVRLTEQALAELRGRIGDLVRSYTESSCREAGSGAVWTRLVVAVVDLQDRQPAPPGKETSA
ncbi:MAG TPA: winged helix-turn-helix domain-containing protein [Pseudonocardiaceae bacterium]|nr:winged helix-turn-helix domain-containing protein [Pseudonocardiaceae bacterium]